ncbi:hypothetical protein MPER_13685 [Moniliophthora perniciosa FA553]|nr:hypothetical protein MPER_13685 [Moniliophthora perniciosa FA553]
MGSLIKSGHTEVTEKLRRKVNRVVQGYVEQGVAEAPGGEHVARVFNGTDCDPCHDSHGWLYT